MCINRREECEKKTVTMMPSCIRIKVVVSYRRIFSGEGRIQKHNVRSVCGHQELQRQDHAGNQQGMPLQGSTEKMQK